MPRQYTTRRERKRLWCAFFLLLALVLFAPPVSLLLFLAVCGVFDALMPKTFPSIRPPRQ